MIAWLPLLILSAHPTMPIEHRYAETIFETDFGESSDLNYDGWPDGWTRRRGEGFPQYVRIQIQIEDDPASQTEPSRYLRIDLDGSGAVAYSPPIEISPLFSYMFRGKLRTQKLDHDVAYFTVSFFDQERKVREVFTSDKLTNAATWQELRIGPLTPTDPAARFAVIGLHLVPTARADLTGAAMFDDLQFARLPNMTLRTAQPHNVFSNPDAPEITCTVSGIGQSDASVLLELLDVSGRTLVSEQHTIVTANQSDDEQLLSAETQPKAQPAAKDATGHAGTIQWRPAFPDYGFYRVRASLKSNDSVTLQDTLPIVIMRDPALQRKGEFGWSLPRSNLTLPDDALIRLLSIANVSWIKYPIWYDPDEETAEGERIAAMADNLSATGIEMVGVFDRPPKQVYERYWNKKELTVAEAFLESDIWQQAIDPLMTRLSLKIRWWQLGEDTDDSFIDYQGLEQKVREIRSHLRKFGQRTRIGLAWRWMHEVPKTARPPWDFMAMTETPSFTCVELARYSKQATAAGTRYWVTLQPLPRNTYNYETRAQDLVLRMVEAKVDGAPAIFVGNPFDASRGLLDRNGIPSDLFLPWCITSKLLSNTRYLGKLQLPNGSSNYVFARDGQAMMVVWNEMPVTESLYLGDTPLQVDPWGRETALAHLDQQPSQPQRVAVGPLPTFVTGLNLSVARWRLQFSFEPDKLVSTFGHKQTSEYRFQNTFNQGVGGSLELHVPKVWQVGTPKLRFKLGTDEDLRQNIEILLRANASSGPQSVRVDFDIFADQQYHFSVYRKIQVGLGDVLVELDTWLNDDGKLVVEQRVLNQTDKRLDFNCYLFAPGRRRMRMQIFDVGPGRVTHTFFLRNGRELVGKPLWLRLEETGSGRHYNYHAVAQP